MSDNNINSVESKNNYNKDVQDRYKAKCMQIAIRYGLNDEDKRVSEAIEIYCKKYDISRGAFTRSAIREKLERDGFLPDDI